MAKLSKGITVIPNFLFRKKGRHVMLPKEKAKLVPKSKLMTEGEWRQLGVQQSRGWMHYMIHKPEPHILLFRRPLQGEAPSQEEQIKEEEE